MKKFISISAMALAVCALATVSCKKEINTPSEETGVVFKASSEALLPAKTSISDDGVSWVKDDAIAVLWGADGVATGIASASGKSCVIVAKDAGEADKYYAFYPQSGYTSYADGSVTFSVPAESNGAFADANKSFAFTSAQDKSFEFKNVTGMIHFSVNSADIDKVVFAATAPVAGTLSVSFDKDGQLVLGDASETGNTITIAVGESREAYFSVLAGATLANGFTATCYDGETPVAVVSSATSVTIDRAELWDLGVLDSHIVTDYFVTPAGAGLKNGKNWENAFDAAALGALLLTPDVEDAEAVAIQALKLNGTTIHMAEGDYVIANPTKGLCHTDFAANDGKVSVTFRGGYPAGLTGKTTDGRDAATYKTAFSGNNQYGILSLGHKLDFTFDGIAFKNAHSNGNSRRAFSVSASSPEDASVSFTACSFTDNIEENTNYSGAGAVIFGASVSFENCSFSGNKSRNGSAINMANGAVVSAVGCAFTNNNSYNTSAAVQNASATLTMDNCTFTSNTATGYGGAVHSNGENTLTTLKNSTFDSNSGGNGGAVSVQNATVLLQGCTFKKNQSTSHGGALYVFNASADLTIDDCTFTGNSASGANNGGVGYLSDGKLTIKSSTFTGNQAQNGGCFRAEPVTANKTVITITDSHFLKNVCRNTGGALAFVGSKAYSVSVSGCEFSENECVYASGAIHMGNAGLVAEISDCTFSKNYSIQESGYSYPTIQQTDGKSSFDNCLFDSNYGKNANSATGVAFSAHKSAFAKFNKSRFIGNNKGNRGLIRTDNTSIVYFNECLFKDNNIANSNGNIVHQNGGNSCTDAVLMNGCTIYNNTGPYDFNTTSYFLLANSTVIGNCTSVVIRSYYHPAYLINNLCVAPSGKNMFQNNNSTLNSGGYNIFNNMENATGSKKGTDYIGTVSGNFDPTSGKYVWSGPASLGGFTPATATEVKNAIRNNFNYTLGGITNIGDAFATWVESVGGFRTATEWWPGAYQAE